jgi:putative ABC transport system ATP-binding protein
MKSIVKTKLLEKIYGENETEVIALDKVDIEFLEGQFTAIMGPSGSGKSTLLHCLAGLDGPTSGSIYINNIDLSKLNDKQLTKLRRDSFGFVFQAFNLIPTLTAAENISLPSSIAGNSPEEEWLEKIIQTLDLRDRLNHRPNELSGGQQQRVAAARALASKPEVIFADEPTGNLDSTSSEELLTFLKTIVYELKQTIIMVTHDPVAASYADRVIFLRDGSIFNDLSKPSKEDIIKTVSDISSKG